MGKIANFAARPFQPVCCFIGPAFGEGTEGTTNRKIRDMTIHPFFTFFRDLLHARADNAIERQRVTVYLLHVILVVVTVAMQFLGMGGSQQPLPLTVSGFHLLVCLVAFALFLARRLTVPQALTIVTIVSQCCIAVRCFFLASTQQDPHYLQLILGNQVFTVLAVFFLVMAFVKITPFIITTISLATYTLTAAYLHTPALWRVFCFFVFVEFFICVVGEILRRNVLSVSDENRDLHYWESALMRAVQLNRREIEGYLRMSSNSNPTSDDVDRLFAMFSPRSQCNIINTVRLYLRSHLANNSRINELFSGLTKSERNVCSLVLQGKKRSEICQLLGKSEKNIDVVRTHVRRKLNVPQGEDLQQFLVEWLEEHSNPLVEEDK